MPWLAACAQDPYPTRVTLQHIVAGSDQVPDARRESTVRAEDGIEEIAQRAPIPETHRRRLAMRVRALLCLQPHAHLPIRRYSRTKTAGSRRVMYPKYAIFHNQLPHGLQESLTVAISRNVTSQTRPIDTDYSYNTVSIRDKLISAPR